jgi:hypothetical protein
MNRIVVCLAVVAGFTLGTNASQLRAEEKAKHASLVHTVIFYLKKDAPDSTIDALIADARESLSKIPTVRGLKVGRRCEQSKGNFNDKDFQIGLLVLFDNFEGLQTYIDHPNHKDFVKRMNEKNVIEKVVVFDFDTSEK